jgi:transcription initiation factor IIF auxiliary subunit
MKTTQYQKAKNNLKVTSSMAKSQFSNDKPMIRQIINDSIDNLANEYHLSEKKQDMLHNYACTLHP